MSRSSKFWHDKCVIITGASSGIGRALAEHVALRGAKLGLLARRAGPLAELAGAIQTEGGKAGFAIADVVHLEATRAAVKAIEEQLGPCDVLVASAGVYHKTHAAQFNPAVANEVIATNVLGVINAFGAVLPGMVKRRRGHLVALASIAGMLGLPAAGAYSASKAAVITLLESLRMDLQPVGVKVTAICPGHVDTPMLSDHERTTAKNVLSAEETAHRIARAVECGWPEYWFPKRPWLAAKIARFLPAGLYRRVVSHYPEMEEPQPS